jgi:hypothetical protein
MIGLVPKRKTSAELDREVEGIIHQSRGATLVYHAIGGDGDPWPAWLRGYAKARLIARLKPRDNLTEHPDGELEDAPF